MWRLRGSMFSEVSWLCEEERKGFLFFLSMEFVMMNQKTQHERERERQRQFRNCNRVRGTNNIGRIYRFERRDRDDNNTQKTQIIKLC
ncbi:hypothetical protein QL285_020052 [Trifolium repens]|nr:hypothetical protein QL285_020052 [Trifolium repens]